MPERPVVRSARVLRHILFLVAAVSWGLSRAVECGPTHIDDKSAIACRVDASREELRLFLTGAAGQPLHTFTALERLLEPQRKRLVFAMNAGMFHPDYSPVGLFIDDRRLVSALSTSDRAGNFFLKPNGVFFVGKDGPAILEASQFAALKEEVVLATQSGPLLVQEGELHPRLRAKSTSRVIRNGVGIDRSGTVVFAITEDPMSLHEVARLFRDTLSCPNALYLDGSISSIHVPGRRQSIQRAKLGPIIAVVEDDAAER